MDTKFECDIYMCVCVNNMTIQGAIKSANNTKYGLTACIVTKSLDIANTVSSRFTRALFGSIVILPLGGILEWKLSTSTCKLNLL